MATYRLGLYGFDALALTGGAGADQPAASPGQEFRLSGHGSVLTPVLVTTAEPAAGGDRARIAPGSGFGTEGQAVDLPCRLNVVGIDAVPHHLTCEVLTLDGVPAGFLANEPLRPGVTYRVTVATGVDPAEDIGAVLSGLDPSLSREATALSWEAVFCFTAGTPVDTPDGPRLIEKLTPGDLVTTLGNGSQPLRWIGSRQVTVTELLLAPNLQPVEFAAGVIGNTGPLRVAPQHRLLLNDWRAQVFFGEDEVLIPATAMVNGRTIRQVLPASGVTYLHLLFDRHEVIVSDGALSESFHPGATGLLSLDEAERRELEQLFPGTELIRRRSAFPIVKLSEARALRLPD